MMGGAATVVVVVVVGTVTTTVFVVFVVFVSGIFGCDDGSTDGRGVSFGSLSCNES